MRKDSTSWEHVGGWYSDLVGADGHYYHQNIVIPGVLRLLHLDNKSRLLDLACGQGILSREIPEEVSYCGVDISPSLLKEARRLNQRRGVDFILGDLTKELKLSRNDFSHAAIILALQDIEDPNTVFRNVSVAMAPEGRFILVIRHPCFRIPRQSSWEVDLKNKTQFRRINRYLSPLKIPIQVNPGQKERSAMTWTFHHSISDYSKFLLDNGFLIEVIEEWVSDKKSRGKMAKMENRARSEIPLFMAISARKRVLTP